MNDNTTTLAALGILSAAVAGILWIIKFILKTLSKDLQEHTKAALKQAQASEEVLTFMKNLNGKLESATIQKVEQRRRERVNQGVRGRND
jgi:hypothetical protein